MNNLRIRNLELYVLLTIIVITAGCDSASENSKSEKVQASNHEFRVIGVSDYDFLFNDSDAGGAIKFRSAALKQCRLSFIKSKFVQGYTTQVKALGKGDIDLTCMTDENIFTLNDSGSTYAEMEIPALADRAIVKLNFSLFSMKSKTNLTKENATLELNQKQVSQLVN